MYFLNHTKLDNDFFKFFIKTYSEYFTKSFIFITFIMLFGILVIKLIINLIWRLIIFYLILI